EPEEPTVDEFDISARGKAEKTLEIAGRPWTEAQIATAIQIAQQAVAQQQQAQAAAQAPAEITNEMIQKVYGPVAAEIENDLVAKGLVDEDLVEAYNKTFRCFVAQARFLADKIFDNKAKLHQVINRFEATLSWLHAFKNAVETH